MPTKRAKHIAVLQLRVRVAWCQRERAFIALQCVEVAAEISQCKTSVVVNGRVCRPYIQHFFKS